MDFIVENGDEICDTVSLKDVPGGPTSTLFAGLLATFHSRVGELCKKLEWKRLDIDGSRDTMIAALRENA
ncbi:hypothetical protein ACHAXR_008617 [Thalassiosira sp. AJA248-18]